jgi:hypothetical protein
MFEDTEHLGIAGAAGVTLEVTKKRVFTAFIFLLATWCGLAVLLRVSRHGSVPTDLHADVLRQPGNAPAEVKAGVRAALKEFQDGYVQRDPKNLDAFMDRLFEKNDDILILGTGRSEWSRGYPAAVEFVRRDWAGWGDFRFNVNDALVSSHGDVAWVATVGTVQLRHSNRQVRFSAVLTRHGNKWLFRQMQFQYEDRPVTPANLLLLRR